jgi:penicillin-binding protein-related factor A (putative recombinase)
MKSALRESEKDIEKSILRYLEHLSHCFAWKNNSTGIFDPQKKIFRKSRNKYAINGVSDILGVYRGRFLAIEVKRPENRERPIDQRIFIDHINKQGGIAFFATSLEEVRAKLAEIDNEIQKEASSYRGSTTHSIQPS